MTDDSTICTIYLYAFSKIVLQSCTSPFSILSKKLVTYMQAICNLQVNYISVLLCALTDQNSFCLCRHHLSNLIGLFTVLFHKKYSFDTTCAHGANSEVT